MSHVHGSEDKVVKMAIFPKLIYRLNIIIIMASFFVGINKMILNLVRTFKEPRIGQKKKKNNIGEISFSDFKLITKLY